MLKTPNVVKMPAIKLPPSHSCVLPLIECRWETMCSDAFPTRSSSCLLYHVIVFRSNAPQSVCCCSNRTVERIEFSSNFQACQLALLEFFVWRRTEMTAERARWWGKWTDRKKTPGTCHPPLPDPASTPIMATMRGGNLIIVNTTLQVCEMRNAAQWSNPS